MNMVRSYKLQIIVAALIGGLVLIIPSYSLIAEDSPKTSITNGNQEGPRSYKIPNLLHAKTVPMDRSKLLELFRSTASQLGSASSEQELRNFTKMAHFPGKDYLSSSIQDNFDIPAAEPEPRKVISHLRSTYGIALPVKGEFPFPGGPQAAIDPQQLLQATLFGANQMKKLLEQKPLPRLPKCTENKSERARTGLPQEDSVVQGTVMDFIFLDESLPNLPVTDLFGDTPIVVQYNDHSMYYLSMVTQSLKAPCLPFRVRSTVNYLIKDYGLNALKIYDEDQHGEGQLHEYFVTKYGLNLNPGKHGKKKR